MNELQIFEEKHAVQFQQLQLLKKSIKNLIDQEDKLKEELKEAFQKYNIKSINNDFVKIEKISESQSRTIDLKAFERNEPEEYQALLADYPKVTTRKGFIRITVK